MANKHMKRFPTLLIIREIQLKTTKYNFITTRVAIIKKIQILTNLCEDMEKLEPSCIAGKNINDAINVENSMVPTQTEGGSASPSPTTQMIISFGNTLTDISRNNTLHPSIQSS